MLTVLFIIGGLGLLVAGAEGLVRGASRFAGRMGLPPLLIGLTIVAFGTSAPELAVSLRAAAERNGDLALGNVVGSNIVNIGLILAVAALVRPVRCHLAAVRRDGPVMLGVTLLVLLLLADEVLSRGEAVLLLIVLAGYLAMALRSGPTAVPASAALAAPAPNGRSGFLWDAVYVVLGLGALVLGSRLFLFGALEAARLLGIPDALIALTLVAVGTSLPEFATSLLAAVRGNSDIALGNVIGSNIFNLAGILGLSAALFPLHAPNIAIADLWVMLGFAAAVIPFTTTRLRLSRWEGGLLLVTYAGYLALIAGGA